MRATLSQCDNKVCERSRSTIMGATDVISRPADDTGMFRRFTIRNSSCRLRDKKAFRFSEFPGSVGLIRWSSSENWSSSGSDYR